MSLSTNTTYRVFSEKLGGTDPSQFVGNDGELFFNPSIPALKLSDGSTPGGIGIGTSVPQSVHGCFHKMANVIAEDADTVYNFDWFTDVTQHVGDQGVTVTSGEPTRLNISTAGDYLVMLEMIIKITGNAERNVFLWLAKNGNDIAETGVRISLRQGVNPVYQTVAKPWLLHDINANDYIQLRFAVSREDGISLEFTTAQTTPYVRPAIPSAVITVAQI